MALSAHQDELGAFETERKTQRSLKWGLWDNKQKFMWKFYEVFPSGFANYALKSQSLLFSPPPAVSHSRTHTEPGLKLHSSKRPHVTWRSSGNWELLECHQVKFRIKLRYVETKSTRMSIKPENVLHKPWMVVLYCRSFGSDGVTRRRLEDWEHFKVFISSLPNPCHTSPSLIFKSN